MLMMYCTPGGEKCQEIGRKFVNDRLIRLVDDAIMFYVHMCGKDERYREKITCPADWEKPLDEIVDMERLSQDEKFFSEYLDMMGLVPRTVGPQRALRDFFSLRKLLRAKKEYKPDLSMEYILLALINMELDLCKDEPESHERVKRIQDNDRQLMMEELRIDAEQNRAGAKELYANETLEETAESLMAYYEDLDMYEETCFEDIDCLFLDDMDEDEMERSGMADFLGMNIVGDEAKVKVEGNGQQFEFSIPAWEVEG